MLNTLYRLLEATSQALRRMVGSPYRAATLLIVGMMLLPVLAWAAGADAPPTPDTDAAAWIKALYAAYTDGSWKVFGGLITLGAVYLLRRFGPSFTSKRWWGYALASLISLGVTFGTAFAVGGGWSLGLAISAVGTALTASGLWELLKDTGAAKNPPDKSASKPALA